jgi:hypothetical protein
VVWVVVVIAAMVFLCWFGNYTAAMYRRIYGHLPAVVEPTKKFYGDEPKHEYTMRDYGACVTVASFCSSAVISPYMAAKLR